MQIRVKPIGAAQIQRLDDHLNQQTAAAVEQNMKNGQYFYEAAADGTYTVRVLQAHPTTITLVKAIIQHNGFEVVSEVNQGQ